MTEEPDLTCYCSVCGRTLQYGDWQSPMLTDAVWRQIVAHYALTGHEKRATELYQRSSVPELSDRDVHTFICIGCMEKALQRRLIMSDVTACPFNKEFVMEYFGFTKAEADELCGDD